MNDDKTRKLTGRWKKGGQRNRKEDAKILAKIRPVDGWRNGARVNVRPFRDADDIAYIAHRIRTDEALARVGRIYL